MLFLHQFLEMMAIERGVTRSTLSAYEGDLHSFYEFFKDQKVDQLTFQDIQDYLFTQNHLSASTVARRISSLRQFYTFLIMRGQTTENPFSLVKSIRPISAASPFLSEGDIDRLLEGARTWGGPEGKRLFALLQILCSNDILVNDLVSLPFAGESGTQIMNLSMTALEALQEYLLVRSYFLPQEKVSSWLFPSTSLKGHLTRQRLGQLLKELALKVGLESKLISLAIVRQGLRHYKQKKEH